MRDTYPLSLNIVAEHFDLVHCNLWRPYKVPSTCGASYFLTVLDDFSQFFWIFLLAEKEEVASTLKQFFDMIHTQFHKTINGTEFTCLSSYFLDNGNIYQIIMVHTPQQNSRVE